ncbi:hypothetical protein Q4R98_00965 [Morganella morganii]|uniref:hypothetical protein n=1 Tax=Morganella morganii TaxID=582 RepID=UPI000F7BEE2C|nr:hypothetical protein [Morganella morganii]AZP27303.1 hypothetical protein D8758_18310 [Morganella morganii]EKU4002651.1 hypothetical protein [Morganella morganii]MBT0337723.1 hypothetical protein [Morganella morganii subsp. morganii]MBT0407441.1 hypothetical protein [Morganella morganii subsp. morganii]MBT0425689.1 hypothetical protein [Morganella morganii subsp. morganii]
MLSFEERMALLEAALSEYTPESLFEELSKFPAYGRSLAAHVVEVSERVTVIEPSNLDAPSRRNIIFSSETYDMGEAA